MTLTVLLFTSVLAILLGAVLAIGRIRLFRLARRRGSWGFEQFRSGMTADLIPDSLLRLVFDQLQEKLRGPFCPLLWLRIDFPIQPDDELSTWGMDREDVKDFIREMCSIAGRVPPASFGGDRHSLTTVRDLAEYLAALPPVPSPK